VLEEARPSTFLVALIYYAVCVIMQVKLHILYCSDLATLAS
jgi:hypothetical protein